MPVWCYWNHLLGWSQISVKSTAYWTSCPDRHTRSHGKDQFIPNLSAKSVCLRELLQHNTMFEWTARNEQEWNKLKHTLTTAPVLAFFDPSKRTKISTDALKDNLGAVLLQAERDKWQPFAYASRSLTETEQRYAQIEKETQALGLVFGCGKFHSYVCLWLANLHSWNRSQTADLHHQK